MPWLGSLPCRYKGVGDKEKTRFAFGKLRPVKVVIVKMGYPWVLVG